MNQIVECAGCGRFLKLKPGQVRTVPRRCPICQAQDIRSLGQAQPPKKQKVTASVL